MYLLFFSLLLAFFIRKSFLCARRRTFNLLRACVNTLIDVSLVSLRNISSLVCKEKRCFAALCMTGVVVSLLSGAVVSLLTRVVVSLLSGVIVSLLSGGIVSPHDRIGY